MRSVTTRERGVRYARKRQLRAYGAALSTTRHSRGSPTCEPARSPGSPRGRDRRGHSCAYASTRTHTRACTRSPTSAATCSRLAVPTAKPGLADDPVRNRSRAFLLNRKSAGSRGYPSRSHARARALRLCAHTRDGRNSKDRSDKVALYRLGTRVTPLIIIVGLLLFHLARARARASTPRLFAFMSARTHARMSAPVLTARAADSRRHQRVHVRTHTCADVCARVCARARADDDGEEQI